MTPATPTNSSVDMWDGGFGSDSNSFGKSPRAT